ncbi:MAG: hypothetical protein ACREP7_06325 [Lysobacter sp.]
MNDLAHPSRRQSWQLDAALIVDAVFQADGRPRPWAMLPTSTWRDLATILDERYDRIGFSFYPADGEFALSGIARALELSAPEAMPGAVVNGERYDLQVCEFNAYTAYLLGLTDCNDWHSTDGELRSDDLCFFRDGRIELIAQPWRSMLHFFAVDASFLQQIEAANPRFKGAVFVIENGRFRGI